jgi:hypothetical protein
VLAEAPLCKHEPPTDGFCLVLLPSGHHGYRAGLKKVPKHREDGRC